MITGNHTWLNTIFYILAQVVGSFAGGFLLKVLIPIEYQDKTESNKLGYPKPMPDMLTEA
jgi:glycerol uptake facilitator-like aquaporin